MADHAEHQAAQATDNPYIHCDPPVGRVHEYLRPAIASVLAGDRLATRVRARFAAWFFRQIARWDR